MRCVAIVICASGVICFERSLERHFCWPGRTTKRFTFVKIG